MASSDARVGIDRLIRPELVNFVGYAAVTSPETLEGKVEVSVEDIIKLDGNENPYGCSPRVNQALANYPDINIYPDSTQTEIRKLLQGYTGVGAEHIVAGAGSDQLINLILCLFVSPGEEVISCVPTFAMFRFFIELCDGVPIEVLRDENFAIDVNAVKAAITRKTKIILLATPNNPTGTIMPRQDILEILDTGLPVLYGIITTDNLEQAIERAGTKEGNEGFKVAVNAIEMANLLKGMD